MFAQRKTSAVTLEKRLAALNESKDSWYDDTIESVDRRLAQVRDALSHVRGIVANSSGADANLHQAVALENELGDLERLRSAMFEAQTLEPIPVQKWSSDHYRALPQAHKDELTIEANKFVKANLDAVDNEAELLVRAANAGRKVAERLARTKDARELLAEAFIFSARRVAAKAPRPAQPRVASARTDFADDLVFL